MTEAEMVKICYDKFKVNNNYLDKDSIVEERKGRVDDG